MKHIFALIFACSFLWIDGASSLLAQEHAFGWKPTKHGIKAAPIETHPMFGAAKLPASGSVAQWFFPTNQGDRGACVAFSTWEAFAANYAKTHDGARLDLSALDIYQQCLKIDGSFPYDSGTYGSTAIKVMLTSGALTEKSWPYSMPLNMLAPQNWQTASERDQNKAIKAYAIPSNDGGYATKFAISKLQIGVMVGTLWYNNGFTAKRVSCKTKDLSGKSATVSRCVLPMPKGSPVGGHEVVIVAYDDAMHFPDGHVGGVEFHNHWTAAFGDNGFAWAPYAWFFSARYADDKACIEQITPKQWSKP